MDFFHRMNVLKPNSNGEYELGRYEMGAENMIHSAMQEWKELVNLS